MRESMVACHQSVQVLEMIDADSLPLQRLCLDCCPMPTSSAFAIVDTVERVWWQDQEETSHNNSQDREMTVTQGLFEAQVPSQLH